jgi:phosphoglycerate dehydrogenase-like enzyme
VVIHPLYQAREGAVAQIVTDVPLTEAAVRRLEGLPGVTVRRLPFHEGRWELPADQRRGVHVLLCKLPPANLHDLHDLQFTQITTVGYEHLRDLGLAERPRRLCNARGIFDTAIAEWNLAMMINLVRDLRGMLRNQEHGVWMRSSRYEQEIRGAVLGLWGYGGIGRETARLAKAFGLTVHVLTRGGVRPRGNNYAQPGTGDPDGTLPDRVFVAGQEREFLSGLDFLVLALPHTRQSTGLLGPEQFQALPRTAFVLNPARGPIIQEQALLDALRQNRIAGAALDTHFAYPLPADHPLWRFPNVILTPHISGADKSKHYLGRIADLFTENVRRHLDGRPLFNEVTAEEWREA